MGVLCYGALCLFIRPSVWRHSFCVTARKVSQLSTRNLVYSFTIGPEEVYFFWGHDVDFQGHRGHKGQIQFLQHNSKSFRDFNLNLRTDTCLRSSKIHDHFGVTWVMGVNFRCHCGITQNVLKLSTWNFISGSLGSILGSWGHGGRFWGHWSITQKVLEPTTQNLIQTLD